MIPETAYEFFSDINRGNCGNPPMNFLMSAAFDGEYLLNFLRKA